MGREKITIQCFFHNLASRFPTRQLGLELLNPLLCAVEEGLLLRLGLCSSKAMVVPLGV